MKLEDKLQKDLDIFGKYITKNIFLDSWQKRLWGAWMVLIGDAGIILVRLNPDKLKPTKKE